METIFALASGRGRAGIAVVRVSGSLAWDVAHALSGKLPPVRQLAYRTFRNQSGDILDSGMVAVFEAGHSFTGERVAEFMIHGSPASVAALEAELARFQGVRYAKAGEFTRRAMTAGNLDLTQVEALADLIDADTESQRKQALRVLDGALGRKVATWRHALVRSAALIEANIDFVEEDLGGFSDEVAQLLLPVLADIRGELEGIGAREKIRSGFEVAIIGPVNVGKSTLLNSLAGRDAAITSATAGTTRDVIEVQMDICGLSVTLLDTAGLRETLDDIERLGVERAMRRAREADIRIILLEYPGAPPAIRPGNGDIVVVGRGDLFPEVVESVSGLTGRGLDRLVASVGSQLLRKNASDGFAVRARHRDALSEAEIALTRGLSALDSDLLHLELVAADIRSAVIAMDVLIGKVDVEDLLDDIFSSFCIGK